MNGLDERLSSSGLGGFGSEGSSLGSLAALLMLLRLPDDLLFLSLFLLFFLLAGSSASSSLLNLRFEPFMVGRGVTVPFSAFSDGLKLRGLVVFAMMFGIDAFLRRGLSPTYGWDYVLLMVILFMFVNQCGQSYSDILLVTL